MITFILPDNFNGTRLTTKAMRQAQVDYLMASNAADIANAAHQEAAWKYASAGDYMVDDIQRNLTGWITERHRLEHERALIARAHYDRELRELCRKQGKRGSR